MYITFFKKNHVGGLREGRIKTDKMMTVTLDVLSFRCRALFPYKDIHFLAPGNLQLQ